MITDDLALGRDPNRVEGSLACAAATGFDNALAILRTTSGPLGIERIPLGRAGRRVLAQAVVSRVDSPRRDVAAMDGFAVRSAELTGAVLSYSEGSGHAGSETPPPLLLHSACPVSTGGAIPPGADRVIPHELTRCLPHGVIVDGVPEKPHIRPKSSDFAAGTTLLKPGATLGPRALLVAAAADIAAVTVWQRPRIAVLTSGDELVPPGMAYGRETAIPDSLSEALLLTARQWGGQPVGSRLLPDSVDAIGDAARDALSGCDILVMAGGASCGPRDCSRQAVMRLGFELQFAGVAMKPGKPAWYATRGDQRVLGLPGNPTAALTVARLFLAPLISALSGTSFDAALRWFDLPVPGVERAAPRRESFLLGMRSGDGGVILPEQDASGQLRLAMADLLIRRPHSAKQLDMAPTLRCLTF